MVAFNERPRRSWRPVTPPEMLRDLAMGLLHVRAKLDVQVRVMPSAFSVNVYEVVAYRGGAELCRQLWSEPRARRRGREAYGRAWRQGVYRIVAGIVRAEGVEA